MNKTFENCTLLDTYSWFAKARPNPGLKHFNSQLGCHYEEVSESLEQLDGMDFKTDQLIAKAQAAIHELAEHLKGNSEEVLVSIKSEVLFLDALCDQVVTATGVGYTRGYDIVGAVNEVNASNFSKFDVDGKPIHDPNGKVMKGPKYFKAQLEPFVKQE